MIPYNLNQSSLSKIHFSLNICGAGSFLSCFSNSDVKLWPDTNEYSDGEILYLSALFFHPATAPFSLFIAQMHYQTLYTDFIFMQDQFSLYFYCEPEYSSYRNVHYIFFFDSWRPCVLNKKLTVHQFGFSLETKLPVFSTNMHSVNDWPLERSLRFRPAVNEAEIDLDRKVKQTL